MRLIGGRTMARGSGSHCKEYWMLEESDVGKRERCRGVAVRKSKGSQDAFMLLCHPINVSS